MLESRLNFLIGASGSGKTRFIKDSIIPKTFLSKKSVLIVDPGGDYSEVSKSTDAFSIGFLDELGGNSSSNNQCVVTVHSNMSLREGEVNLKLEDGLLSQQKPEVLVIDEAWLLVSIMDELFEFCQKALNNGCEIYLVIQNESDLIPFEQQNAGSKQNIIFN